MRRARNDCTIRAEHRHAEKASSRLPLCRAVAPTQGLFKSGGMEQCFSLFGLL